MLKGEKLVDGWKIISVDFKSNGGKFQWPVKTGVWVESHIPAKECVSGPACPTSTTGGLCMATTIAAASSGGLYLSRAVGLDLQYYPSEILGQGEGKIRVRRVKLVGVFDPVQRFCVSGANLTQANLTGANLYGANLTQANLYGADLYGANLTQANLARANLYGANLTQANLTGANLTQANLTGANLYGADLYGANLTQANLARANLTQANLTGANLARADLTSAKGYNP